MTARHAFSRSTLVHPTAIFLACLTLYLYSMPRTVALEDDGMFILAAWFNGIAHPPGYPLFTLIAHAFTQLPWGTVAMRVHAVSALFGALACATLWGVARELQLSNGMATTISLAFGSSAVFWSQSIISEVYTLNTLLLFLAVLLGLRLRRAEKEDHYRTWALLLGLVFGLGLANHWPLVALTAPGILLMLWPRLPLLWRYHLMPGTVALLVGLSPYVWLYFRSQQDPFASFYGPLRDFGDLFYLVSRQGFSDIDNSPSADWSDKLGFLRFFLGELSRQFSFAAVPFLLLGLFRQFRILRPEVAAGLLWIFSANSLLLILLLNFDHEALFESVFRVYPLIAYGVAALWVGIGLAEAGRLLKPRLSNSSSQRLIPVLAACLLVGGSLGNSANANLRLNYRWTEQYAKQFFATLEKNAAVFVDGDIEVGVIGYFRYVEGWRPDVTLYTSVGRILGTRLFDPLTTDLAAQQVVLDGFVTEAKRPIYYSSDLLSPPFGSIDRWLHKQVRRELGQQVTVLPDPAPWFQFLELLLHNTQESDQWTRFHQDIQLRRIMPHLINRIYTSSSPELAIPYRQILDQVVAARPATEITWASEMLFLYPDRETDEALSRRISRLCLLPSNSLSKRDRSIPYYLLGVIHERKGDLSSARSDYQESIRRWHHPSNPSLAALKALKP